MTKTLKVNQDIKDQEVIKNSNDIEILIKKSESLLDKVKELDHKNKEICKCVVKTTEITGIVILYPKIDCPYHGKYNRLK